MQNPLFVMGHLLPWSDLSKHRLTQLQPLLLEYYLFSTQKAKNEDGRPFLTKLLHQGQLLLVLMQ